MVGLVFALLLMQAPDYAADEAAARKAIAADPKDYGAHFNLSLALSLQNQDSEAIAELRKTLELKPGLYEADLNLGILLLRNKRVPEAVPVLKEAVEAKPGVVRPNLYYAQALLETGDVAGAERYYTIAAEADPKSAAAHTGLGGVMLAESKLPEAAEHFRAAGSKDGLLQVAGLYEKGGRINEAIQIYKEFPDDAAVSEHLGRLQVDNKDAAGAIVNLEEAVRKSPTTANRLALADAYRIGKQPAKMMEQLQLAAASDPANYEIRMALGRSLRDERRLLPAAQQFSAATKLRPDSVEAWNELASALIVNENYVDGLAALDRVHALGKEIPGDIFLRAISLDKLKQKPEALAAYRRFLETDNGAHPDQEFQARARARIIESELKRK